MTRRLTDGQRAARRELCALARTALDVCDAVAAKGAEDDDRPRAWLLSMERWARGEEAGAQLAARTRAMKAWLRSGAVSMWLRPCTRATPWGDALHWLDDAREDAAKHPTHAAMHASRVSGHLAAALSALTGDSGDAAMARVVAWRFAHRKAIAREETERERAALAARLKGDKAAAELVLGTAQEMGR